ncbi:YeeE/YedE thiosulfate transporter family protein [Pseudonocardia endophytica]|uniref:Uncharacterized protein n=1 Tax=Pseudonocardia endophytica TaxID=401976 RepID=A0A4R1HF83_PSEEN|nr:YeeE/YedE thiosulfate transporter family protein [Pseudonocardia endophytica]TCK20794.1 hypothetical protein EV378_4758 [Pseudonocardia endophytica]
MRTRGAALFANVVAGLALGFVVANIGFGDYGQLHTMFTLRDPRMLLAFAGAVAIIVVVFAVIGVRRVPPRLHAGVVPGAVLFGIGWAISGGCPAIPLVQLGSGYLPALATIAGIVVGVRLCRRVSPRILPSGTGSCGD